MEKIHSFLSILFVFQKKLNIFVDVHRFGCDIFKNNKKRYDGKKRF